jgi:hypothetical protein
MEVRTGESERDNHLLGDRSEERAKKDYSRRKSKSPPPSKGWLAWNVKGKGKGGGGRGGGGFFKALLSCCSPSFYAALSRKLDTAHVFDPNDDFCRNWDVLTAVLLIFVALVTPFELGFLETHVDTVNGLFLFIVNRLVDLVFFADIFVQLNTAFVDKKGKSVNSRWVIAKHYASTWWGCFFLVFLFPPLFSPPGWGCSHRWRGEGGETKQTVLDPAAKRTLLLEPYV